MTRDLRFIVRYQENLLTASILPRKTLALLFFISGFCGLLYQVVWMRLAFASFGVNTPVLSLVISIFMAGLAGGSWWGGHWAARPSNTSALVLIGFYALAEGLIGLGAFTVPQLFLLGARILLPFGNSDSTLYLFLSALVLLIALLPWCFCMGTTFPLMMAYIEKRSGFKDSFSFLYTANVLGAMTGTLVTALVLIECLGFQGTLIVAASLNALLSLISLSIGLRSSSGVKSIPNSAPKTSSVPVLSGVPFQGILFTTGFISMAMEVVWVRDFTFILKTQVYSYASLLFVYLLSTFAGSSFYRWKGRQKILSLPLLLSSAFIFSLLPVVMNDPRLHHSIVIVLLSIVPFCAVLGFLTPGLVDQFSQGRPEKAGRAYAVNVLGCILGPLTASYLLLPFIGSRVSLILLSLPLILFLLRKNLQPKNNLTGKGLALTGILLLFTSLFWSADYEDCFQRFYPETLLRRDYCATVISNGSGMDKKLYVNGIGMTGLFMPTKLMAHLPLLLLPKRPESALDICFGMGTTFRSLLSWGIDTTAVELVPSVLKAFDYYWTDAARLLALPNAHRFADDGRRFLKRTSRSFDVITVDPPPPLEAAASSLLYSTEFYDLVKKHLNPGGVFQQWLPVGDYTSWIAVSRSIHLSFPYILVFPSRDNEGIHFIASLTPLHTPTPKECLQKMPPLAVRDLEEWIPKNSTRPYLKDLLSKPLPIETFLDASTNYKITDDHPFNEYFLLREWKLKFFHS